MLAARARVAGLYREALAGLEGLELPCRNLEGNIRGWFVFVVQLPVGVSRDGVVRDLAASEVQSKPYLPAIHLMSLYRDRFGYRRREFPICEGVSSASLALPFFPELDENQLERVVARLRAALRTSG
jgi:perosamine synthetase